MSENLENLVLRAEEAATNAANSAKNTAADRAEVERLVSTLNTTKLPSIESSKESIRQAIIGKGQDCDETVPFDQYAIKIANIETKTNLDFITATADDIRAGKVGADINGEPVLGVLEVGTSSTSSMEMYRCVAVYGPSEQPCFIVTGCPTAAGNGTYLPTEFTTGYDTKYPVYKNESDWYYYYDEMDRWSWGLSPDYTRYLDYFQDGSTWYDSNWESAPEMSVDESSITVDENVPKTWDGRKAIKQNGEYIFEESVTTGLTYSDSKPEIYNVYTADASVKIDRVDTSDPFTDGLVFCATLTETADYAETGQKMVNKGATIVDLNGVKCASFDGDESQINIPSNMQLRNSDANASTIIINLYPTKTNKSQIALGAANLTIGLNDGNMRWRKIVFAETHVSHVDASIENTVDSLNEWYTLIFVREKSGLTWSLEGERVVFTGNNTSSYNGIDSRYKGLTIGNRYDNYDDQGFEGYINQVRLYERAFTYEEAIDFVRKYGFSGKYKVYDTPQKICHFSMNETGDSVTDDISGLVLTKVGNMQSGVTGRNGTCWEASESGSYLSGINKAFAFPQRFTFSFDVNISNDTSGCLVDFGGLDYQTGFGIWYQYGNLKVRISNKQYTTDQGAISTGEWHTITCTWDGKFLTLYMEGNKIQAFKHSVPLIAHGHGSDSKVKFFMRGDKDNEGQTYGKIDEVSMWNYAMTAAEVAALYNELMGSGDDSGKQPAYIVSGSDTEIANGDYYDTGRIGWENDYPIYSNDKGCYMTYFAEMWRILNAEQFDNDAEDIEMYETATAHEDYHSDPSKAWWSEYLTVVSTSSSDVE